MLQDRDEQTKLEMKHRQEEDDLYRKFSKHREEENRRIREEIQVIYYCVKTVPDERVGDLKCQKHHLVVISTAN